MEYKTRWKDYFLLIKPDTGALSQLDSTQSYMVYQCFSDYKPVVGWGKYPNAMQALRSFKQHINSRSN